MGVEDIKQYRKHVMDNAITLSNGQFESVENAIKKEIDSNPDIESIYYHHDLNTHAVRALEEAGYTVSWQSARNEGYYEISGW